MRIGTGVSYNAIAATLGAGGLTAALAAAGLAMAAPAAAQPSDPCLALPTDAERLLCMRESRAADEASRAAAEAALAASAAAGAQSQVQAQNQAPAQAQTSASAAAGQSAADRCFALPTDAERLSCMRDALAIAEAALAAEQAGEGGGLLGLGIFGGGDGGGGRADPLVASESEFAAGLGAEQLSGYRAPQEDVRVQAAIVSVTEREPGIHQFELDNGQVWRQLGGDTQAVRLGSRGPYPVELYGSWAGGYRMSIPSQRQTLQVERIR